MISKYLQSIVRIVDRGLKSNSYKFALLRALSDFGKQKLNTDSIGFEWLAERFIGYYWPLTVKSKEQGITWSRLRKWETFGSPTRLGHVRAACRAKFYLEH